MARKISVLTVARSDYGILRPVLRDLAQRKTIATDLIVTGMHLDPRFGNTIEEIRSDNQPIAYQVDTRRSGDGALDISRAMGTEITGLSEVFEASQPDILVILGDRFEMLAGAVAALPYNIPIAHIHGGEASFGAIDDAMRHAITKLAHLHFPATEDYGNRIRQMGEEPFRITISGAPGLDNILALDRPSPQDVADQFGFKFTPNDPPVLVTFHPETRSALPPAAQVDELLAALDNCPLPQLFTLPNADTGGLEIADRIEQFCKRNTRAALVDNLGTANYFAMLATAPAMIGNSSSGIIEAASFALPVVNIGDRQKGRACGRNVLHCQLERSDIETTIEAATDPAFRKSLEGLENMYGDGQASRRIGDKLEHVELSSELLTKHFVDQTSV